MTPKVWSEGGTIGHSPSSPLEIVRQLAAKTGD